MRPTPHWCSDVARSSAFATGLSIPVAEVVSASTGTSLKELSGQKLPADLAEHLRKATHLRNAIVERARARGDSAADLARILDMSVGHWYRIKKQPVRLARLTLQRLDAIAKYVGWPRVQVMIAIGWLQRTEVDQMVSVDQALQDALRRLELGGLASGLVTPLARAAGDHRLLMARLLLLAEAAVSGVTNLSLR